MVQRDPGDKLGGQDHTDPPRGPGSLGDSTSVWQSILAPLPSLMLGWSCMGTMGKLVQGAGMLLTLWVVCLLLWLLQEARQPSFQGRDFCLKQVASAFFLS